MRFNFKEITAGKWRGILVALGFQPEMLNGKHQPCPACGGVDRYRFDDKNGTGSFYCSQCGAGYGIDLVMRVKDWDFKTAAAEVEKAAGFVRMEPAKQAKNETEIREALRRMWKDSVPVTEGDPVSQYLTGRGLIVPASGALRYAPSIWYRDDSLKCKSQAMLALVVGPDNEGKSIHRTYIAEGKKAGFPTPKKLMTGFGVSGAAVRLFKQEPCLGIAEGIESALAASALWQMPVWAAVSAGGMESWVCPASVTEVVVFGDNDENMVGQRAAYGLAGRLAKDRIKVRVELPQDAGKDWADYV